MTETSAGAAPLFVDADSFSPLVDELQPSDPLQFPGYVDELARAREQSGATESLSVGHATVDGLNVIAAQFNFGFLAGSLGTVAGERLARGLEHAATGGFPFVLRTATGGARMQEGMAALVQMPKLVTARKGLADAGVPLIAVLGHPTTGGVLASNAALADVTLAEAGATVGFAGPRLVEQVSGRRLRAGSHTAEGALSAGLVDAVTEPDELPSVLGRLLEVLSP
ncbi:MAG TPA: carboxyl transferase domain-containing protein, partial [Actinomycetota bacterium]|nr:carboxyl transferase domain-containing protein [Actinomycetota bacterium]